MIDVTDPSKIVFDVEPYNFKDENVYPVLRVLEIEQNDEYYKLKVEGKNLRARISYQEDTSKYHNSYEMVYDVEAHIISPMNALFYITVPKKDFSYLAKNVKLSYKDLKVELIECNVDLVFETNDFSVNNNNYLVTKAQNNFSEVWDNEVFYSIYA